MSHVPDNIKRVLQQNAASELATAYANSLRVGNSKAKWYTNDFHRLETMKSLPVKSTQRVDTRQELKDNGLRSGIEAVKLKRQARLKSLMEAEQIQYEAELNAMGLSLVKPTD